MSGPAQTRCETLSSPGRVREVLEANRKAPFVALEVLTESPGAVGSPFLGAGLCFEPGAACFVPLLDELHPLLGPGGPPKVAHDAKFGLVVLGWQGVEAGPPAFDTLLAAFLLDGSARTLEHLAARLGAEAPPVDTREEAQSACARADTVLRLRPLLEAELEERGQLRYLHELELPLVPVLADMELAGIAVDTGILQRLSHQLEVRLRELEAEMEEAVGRELNPKSPRQLSELLYEDLGLEGSRKTSSGRYSTDALALEALAGQHPVVEKILEHRWLSRLKDAYADALPKLVNPHTGRLHTTFSQVSASSGRIISREPNLQNIPVRTELGREIRKSFVAGGPIVPGPSVLLAADYSQIELRVLAHVAGEERLCEAFRKKEDVHALAAARLYDMPREEVTLEMRRVGKMLNYGVIYGMSGYRLALETGIERGAATRFVRRHREQYPSVRAYFEETLLQAEERGYVATPFGRRRYLPELRSTNRQRREAARRAAENMPNQGMVAEIIKRAMISVHARLREEGANARMLLQVHDELLFEVPEDELHETAALVVREMEGAARLSVPLEVESKYGPSWGEMRPLGR